MEIGWHCTRGHWFYGTDMSHTETPPAEEQRPDARRMYVEGPCRAINTDLRTGSSTYEPEKNFGVPFQTLVSELDAELDKGVSCPDIVTRIDDGQLAAYIEDGYVVDNGYLSATNSRQFRNLGCAFRYKIVGLKPGCGADISEGSVFEEEKEFLFKRGSKFRVVSERMFKANGQPGHEYVLEYIGRGRAKTHEKAALTQRYTKRCAFCNGWNVWNAWECIHCGST